MGPITPWCPIDAQQPIRAAQSYSTALKVARQGAACPDEPLPLTLLSQHTNAYNLITATGVILALVTPQQGNGPFQIVLPAPLPPLPPAGQPIHGTWHQTKLSLAHWQITLTTAQAWNPQIPKLTAARANAYQTLVTITQPFPASPLAPGNGPFAQRAQQGLAALQRGLITQNDDQVRNGVIQLAGLGPGLTPAGDDFLVGLLAARHAQHDQRATAIAHYGALIGATAASRTTRLSATWLRHAGQGNFGERWHQLITALNAGPPQPIIQATHRILTTGATSGSDAMYGFLFGLGLET
ncbi:MAG: DUF2877 domain-containing protein [Caldilineaceae bacterium]|nr:DUF2877 domain-containing protein [Caldilineaceae bacterium]